MSKVKRRHQRVVKKLSESFESSEHDTECRFELVSPSGDGKENAGLSLKISSKSSLSKKLITPGDFVVVAGPSESKNYIGKVSNFYKNKFSDELNANITWLYCPFEISQKSLPADVHPNELYMSVTKRVDIIDVSTILRPCTVEWVSPNSLITKEFAQDEFFYRRFFDGKVLKDAVCPNDNKHRTSAEINGTLSQKRSRQAPSRYSEYVSGNLDKEPKPPQQVQPLPRPSKRAPLVASISCDSPNSTKKPLIASRPIMSPSRSLTNNCPMASPVSASGFGKLDASVIAIDLMDDDDDDALSESEAESKTSDVKEEKLQTPKTNRSSTRKRSRRHHAETKSTNNSTGIASKDIMICIPKTKVTRNSSVSLKSKHPARMRDTDKLNKCDESSSSDESCSLESLRRKESTKKWNRSPSPTANRRKVNKPQELSKCLSQHTGPKTMEVNTSESNQPQDDGVPARRISQLNVQPMRSSPRTKAKVVYATKRDDDEDVDDGESGSDFDEKLSESTSSEDFDSNDEISSTYQKPSGKAKNVAGATCKTTATPAKIWTPKNKLPFIPARQTPVRAAKGGLEKSRKRLHVSAIPQCLPCRDNEFREVYNFVEGKLRSGGGGCMYVSGVPGTGKTATVQDVMNCLRQSAENDELPNFTFVDINGMRLTEPRQAYVQLLWQLNNQKATADHAADLLNKLFSQRRKLATVVIADELDLLWTKKQDVLYHLFDWPTHRHAKLIIVAIANTMDLPERVMMNRVSSRLGLTRLTFRPYNFKQLQEIVCSRLEGLNTFESDAVQLASRKVAAVSGDARRCLDICRRATEIAEHKQKKIVGIEQVHEALQEMFATPMVQAIRGCSKQEKLFLRAVTAEFHRSGMEEATLGMIIHHHSTLCQVEGASPVSVSTLIHISQRLATNRIILLEGGHRDLFSRIRLNVSVDDVIFSLSE